MLSHHEVIRMQALRSKPLYTRRALLGPVAMRVLAQTPLCNRLVCRAAARSAGVLGHRRLALV